MTRCLFDRNRPVALVFGLLLVLDAARLKAEPTAAALAAFHTYCARVEARLVRQHRGPDEFLAPYGGDAKRGAEVRLRRGETIIQSIVEPGDAPSSASLAGAMLHHWRGTAFAPGARAEDFERLMRNFNAYPQHFAPEVVEAGTTQESGDRMQAWMRIRQRHVITVVMDTAYDIAFGRLDARHGFSISRSTRVTEIASPGTRAERPLSAREEHGFLWALNTYWSYEERDGGLYLQIEAVSLTRSIPSGLGWLIGPYIESIPRESLEFTLNSARKALQP